jgi:hypothetical protein
VIMRQPIRQRLVAGVPLVAGRVFMRGAADLNTLKPFLLLIIGETRPGLAFTGINPTIEVWIYAKTLTEADAVEAQVLTALDRQRVDEVSASTPSQRYFLVHEEGGSGDFQDQEWGDALVRAVAFRSFEMGWFASETYEPDPVITLRAVTEALWPETQSDPETWNPSDAAPAIYWRIDRINSFERLNWGAWYSATVRGHVIAPDQATQETYTRRVMEQFSLLNRLRLSDDSPLEILTPASLDVNADPMRDGQLRFTVRWGVLSGDFETEYTLSKINHATLAIRNAPRTYSRSISVRVALA